MSIENYRPGKLVRRTILMICLCLCLAVSSFAASPLPVEASTGTFYVSTNGNDGNPGSLDQPWRTIQYAVNHVSAGSVIFIRGGTYYESVAIQKDGAAGSPITVSAYNGESVEINAGSNIALNDAGGHSYWKFQFLTLRSSGRFTVRMGWWSEPKTTNYWTLSQNSIFGAILVRGHDNVIEYNDISGVGYTQDGSGIQDIEEVSYNNIYRYNSIHDFTAWSGRGIWLETRTHDDLVEGNHIWNITGSNGQCIDLDGYNSLEWRHTIRGNTISNCGVVGIQLENSFATVVENNIVSGGGNGSIIVTNYGDGMCQAGGESNQYGDSNYDGSCQGDITGNIIRQNLVINSRGMGGVVSYQASGVQVLNNTIVGSSSYGIWLGNAAYSHDWELRNNIIANTQLITISTSSLSQISIDDYNGLYRSNSQQIYEQTNTGTSYTLEQYRSMTGKGWNSVQANPLFVDPGNDNYRTFNNSPMVDQGGDTGLSIDLDGNRRPQGYGYDIGAYEVYVASVIYENFLYLPAVLRVTR